MGIKLTGPRPGILAAAAAVAASAATSPQAATSLEKAPPVEPVVDAPPSPKTSPAPYRGMQVTYRTQDTKRAYNGTKDHIAFITRLNGGSVNLKVMPDCGDIYDATSQSRISAADEKAQGWF